MIYDLLGEVKGAFGRGFFLVIFLPTSLFALLHLTLYLEIARGLTTYLANWEQLTTALKTLSIIYIFAAILLISLFLDGFMPFMIRLLEGYWVQVPLLQALYWPRVRFHQSRCRFLWHKAQESDPSERQERVSYLLSYYPPLGSLDRCLPTAFGNVMRAVEIYPYERYGIDPAIIWPRLISVLKPDVVTAIEESLLARDKLIVLSMHSAILTMIWCPWLGLLGSDQTLFLLALLGWPLAWFFYKAALQNAIRYGDRIKTLFDLYRHDLLRALNRPIPGDLRDERKEWLRLGRFLYRNVPLPPLADVPSTSETSIEARHSQITAPVSSFSATVSEIPHSLPNDWFSHLFWIVLVGVLAISLWRFH